MLFFDDDLHRWNDCQDSSKQVREIEKQLEERRSCGDVITSALIFMMKETKSTRKIVEL